MNEANSPLAKVTPPADWRREAYPTTDREWLEASFVSVPMKVAVPVLVADPLDGDNDEPVYPLAVTTEANEVVYKRKYDIFAVAETRTDAAEQAERAMDRISDEFTHGQPEFLGSALSKVGEADIDVRPAAVAFHG